jgi:peptide/nickel transport system substrate-binding protein
LVLGTIDLPSRISPLAPSVFSNSGILDLLFLHLHRVDKETGRMQPVLARSWEFSEDLKTITYYLRSDVEWWDGEPVTAHDILYTYQKMKDPETKYANVNALRFIHDVEVVDSYTIRFSFEKVYADILTDSDIVPVPRHVYEERGEQFGEQPVGNGPYRIERWVRGSGLFLTANAEYYRGRPPLDEIQIMHYADLDEMLDDFAEGALDVVLDITPSAAQNLRGNENVTIFSQPGNSYLYIGWNLTHQFLEDKEVRRAMSMAIDVQRILKDVYAGMGEVSLGPLPSSSWGFNGHVQVIVRDVEQARKILRERGFTDYNRNGIIDKGRNDFTLQILTNAENPDRVSILQLITEDLQEIGVRVNAQTLDAAAFINALVEKDFDGYIMGWSVGEKVDPAMFWGSQGRYNFVSYANESVDSLIEAGVSMLDRKRATKIWNEFQEIIYADQPYTFLVVPNKVAATYKRVRGVEHNVKLASASAYWIPEAERRVSVAAVLPENIPTQQSRYEEANAPRTFEPEPSSQDETPEVIAPERILEAAAQSDTTARDTQPTIVATSPPAPPKPSVITRAEATKRVEPQYPAAAAEFGAAGTIVVRVLVGEDGRVKETQLLKTFGNPACEQAALNAARQWQFNPATKDGIPFEQRVSIPFTFSPE